MKWDKVFVKGHQRCGNHYVMALIAKNFYPNDYIVGKYQFLFGEDHHMYPEDWVPNKRHAYIFIQRNWNDVSKSMFKMKGRFGLKANRLDTYLKKNYKSMWSDKIYNKGVIVIDAKGNEQVDSHINNFFSIIDMKPKEYFDNYNKQSRVFVNNYPNMRIFKYEDFIKRFKSTLAKVNNFLGTTVTEFENIDFQIGWKPK